MTDIRQRQFSDALARLDEALQQPKNAFMRDSAIQRFEFTVDLGWKSLAERLERDFGMKPNSPKGAVRAANENKLIADPEAWFAMIDDRNLTSHSYNQELADAIYSRLPGYAALLRILV